MRSLSVPVPILAAFLLAGCGDDEGPAAKEGGGPVQTATLTGLYEGGAGPRRNQLCIVERGGTTRFGIVAWGSGETSCSGEGEVTREGETLRLAMAGDETCVIQARIEGQNVTLPPELPPGCAYYCGPGAQLAGTDFAKVGGAEADALRAADLVGEPLCGT